MTDAERRLIEAALAHRQAQKDEAALPCRGLEEACLAYYIRTSPARTRLWRVEIALRLACDELLQERE